MPPPQRRQFGVRQYCHIRAEFLFAVIWCTIVVGSFWRFRYSLGLEPDEHPKQSSCVAWRATRDCHAFGHRVPRRDLPCSATVKYGPGFCECVGNTTVSRVPCGRVNINCQRECDTWVEATLRNGVAAYDVGDTGVVLPLPKPFECNNSIPYHLNAFFNGKAKEVMPKESDWGEDEERRWQELKQLATQYGVGPKVHMPKARTGRDDWVLEGKKMNRTLVKHIRSTLRSFHAHAPPYPTGGFGGKGVVMVGGGLRYLVPAWVTVHMLRRTGCTLPVELWFVPAEWPTPPVVSAFGELGVACRRFNDSDLNPGGKVSVFALKVIALLLSQFEEAILLDVDNVAIQDPTSLFSSPEYRQHGMIMWPDYWEPTAAPQLADILSIPCDVFPTGTHESGQVVVDKRRHWLGLLTILYFNVNWPVYYELFSCYLGKGDKETFAFGILASNKTYHLIPTPAGSMGIMRMIDCRLPPDECRMDFGGNTMVQHDTKGKVMFLHSNLCKFHLGLPQYFEDYQRRWVVWEPGHKDAVQWIQDTMGTDLEREVFVLLQQLKCRPWWPEFFDTRMAVKDDHGPLLEGFHFIIEGMEFVRMYRAGWSGAYLDILSHTMTSGDTREHKWSRFKRRRLRNWKRAFTSPHMCPAPALTVKLATATPSAMRR